MRIGMKRSLLAVFAVFFACILLTGCSSGGSLDCNNSIDYMSEAGSVVYYNLTGTGSYALTSITWSDESGNHTESPATLPFSKTVNFNAAAPVKLSIAGSVTNGAINGSANMYYTGGKSEYSFECSQQTQ